jgi:7-cyano-7-deazaguanine reductase
VTDPTLALGQETAYPNQYDPSLLFPIPRSDSRNSFLGGDLPFGGVDVWNAWELTWLGPGNLPVVATVEMRIPATSPNLVESKSLKLYLNSFAMSAYSAIGEVEMLITEDLLACVGEAVEVHVQTTADTESCQISQLPGLCLDSIAVTCSSWDVDAAILQADTSIIVEESLHSHLLRSLCPVTAQPDIGSIAVQYRGPKIDPASLLQYIVSFREHNDFHEACIERMFVDILERCTPENLTVLARYQRRGGIDINPVRSNVAVDMKNLRLWRQ